VPRSSFDHDICVAVGTILRRWREARGWTLQDLSDRLNSPMAVPTLSGYECGSTMPSIGRVTDLCLALDVPIAEVVNEAVAAVRPLPLTGTDPTGQQRIARAHINVVTAVAALAHAQEELSELLDT
jgi:transcriptional regulator with XRE-family HTH domain